MLTKTLDNASKLVFNVPNHLQYSHKVLSHFVKVFDDPWLMRFTTKDRIGVDMGRFTPGSTQQAPQKLYKNRTLNICGCWYGRHIKHKFVKLSSIFFITVI